jgi:hypothetical protein
MLSFTERHRTTVRVDLEHPLYRFAVFLVGLDVENLFDPLDHQHLALDLDLPDRIGA